MRKVHLYALTLCFIISNYNDLPAQVKIIDQVVAVVGSNIILESDVENTYLQMRAQGMTSTGDMKCEVLEDLLTQKLMLNQAKVDSIEVTEGQVERELDNRLQMFIDQIGSQERLEAYYNKSLLEIKDDFRKLILEQLLTQQMQSTIASEITVTPSEVKIFYRNTPKDSLPMIPAQIEYSQLLRNPPFSEQSKLAVRQRLLDLRKRIIEGGDFATLAILYSEDPGSAKKGGELGYLSKNDLVPKFANAAFSLKQGAVSPIVETKFGFHIIQMIDRKGERINVRHILIKPKVTAEEKEQALSFLDSLVRQIRMDSILFLTAVRFFSEDEDTRVNGGIMVNPQTGDTKFQLEQLEQATAEAVRSLETGKVSDPFESNDMTGNKVFKIIEITNRIDPHQANFKNDYTVLQEMTKMSMQQEAFFNWIEEKQKTTYIHIDESYKGCHFMSNGWLR
jgi:peptidyl-prolyl cis-trans isomerase SurA